MSEFTVVNHDLEKTFVEDSRADAEAKAARIADNKTAESAWNDDLLATELETLPEFDPEELGFSQSEVDELLEPEDMEVPDSFDEVDDEEIETEHECPECGYEW